MQPMVIEPMAVARLRPYASNARTHSKKQIRQIAASIRKFGFTNPVLISDDDEIIAGHGRVEAARLMRSPLPPMGAIGALQAPNAIHRSVPRPQTSGTLLTPS